MPDFSTFKPTLGSNDYLSRIPAFIDATEAISIEVETARGAFSSLNNRLDNVQSQITATTSEVVTARAAFPTLNGRLNDIPTKTYVQSQVATGGVDVETLGNPHDLIRISAAGDTFEGFFPESNPNDWVKITSDGSAIEGFNGQFLMSFWSSL